MNIDKEITFIAKHYKKGLFSVDPALKRIKKIKQGWWTLPKVAAASFLIVVLGATAAILIRNSYSYKESSISQPESTEIISPALISRVIDFEDTPPPTVIEQINLMYDVEVINIPADANDYYLSLHYEGNAYDLIETINEILGTDMKVKE